MYWLTGNQTENLQLAVFGGVAQPSYIILMMHISYHYSGLVCLAVCLVIFFTPT